MCQHKLDAVARRAHLVEHLLSSLGVGRTFEIKDMLRTRSLDERAVLFAYVFAAVSRGEEIVMNFVAERVLMRGSDPDFAPALLQKSAAPDWAQVGVVHLETYLQKFVGEFGFDEAAPMLLEKLRPEFPADEYMEILP